MSDFDFTEEHGPRRAPASRSRHLQKATPASGRWMVWAGVGMCAAGLLLMLFTASVLLSRQFNKPPPSPRDISREPLLVNSVSVRLLSTRTGGVSVRVFDDFRYGADDYFCI